MNTRKADIPSALQSLRPGAQWVLRGDDYSGLEWLSVDQTKPTEEEVNTEVLKIQAEYDALRYQRDRKKEYPSIEDQLDVLYHEGIDGWKDVIEAVKLKYPKA